MKPGEKALFQALAIVAVSCALAFGVNVVRPDGLALSSTPKSQVELQPEGGEIPLKDAALLHASGRAVFLDARSPLDYAQGHIKGAVSLPPREFASQFQDLKPMLEKAEVVVAYCDGERCPLGENLAQHLRDAGLKNVLVLKNGWTSWTAEGLPVEQGQ